MLRQPLSLQQSRSVALIAAARAKRIDRYVMISSMGADPDASADDTFGVYLRAKGKADAELIQSGLAYTILRPGHLTDDPGAGLVELAESVDSGRVPRDDVAAVVAALLHGPDAAGAILELVSGDTPVDDAVARVASH